MEFSRIVSGALAMAMLSGCATTGRVPDGSKGPELVGSGRATESGQYAEVGVQFTSWGDFVALFAPTRWKSPVATGGSLSWLNPYAWGEDAGRTGRILIGEAVVVGGVAAAAGGGGGGGGDSSSGPTPPGSGSGGVTPPTPPPPAP